MANWFTKALNKVGSAVTGNSDYNVWHDINKVGAGVGGFLKGSVASIPNSIAGAATGALTGMAGGPVGAIAGAITGAVASGAPVVLQGVVAEVNSYDAEHGYEPNETAQNIVDKISGATNIVGKIASGIAGSTGNEKLAGVAGAVANVADVAGSYVEGVGALVSAKDSGGVSGVGGGVVVTLPSGENGGKVSVTPLNLTGWRKDYVPITDKWAKTAPALKME